MRLPLDPPDIVFVRVCTPGGPYLPGDIVTVAFATPGIGRLACHTARSLEASQSAGKAVVPESISVDVTMGANPYATGDRLVLSFVDPAVARIHPSGRHAPANSVFVPHQIPQAAAVARLDASPLPPVARNPEPEAVSIYLAPDATCNAGRRHMGVRITLNWEQARTQRFVRVVDKLFTVERLGWYRHVLAARLLLPDEITMGDAPADATAARQLHALRSAVAQTLGHPLLAACMPNFCVTSEWLDELDNVGTARALGALRDALLPYVDDDASLEPGGLDAYRTVGMVTRRELLAAPSASVEALLPVLIPCQSVHVRLTEKLAGYRSALVDVFAQTAGSAKAVRLNAMSQPNPALDDRLWQLVGAVGESFDGLVVA
jgi:hypothetical protein